MTERLTDKQLKEALSKGASKCGYGTLDDALMDLDQARAENKRLMAENRVYEVALVKTNKLLGALTKSSSGICVHVNAALEGYTP